MPEGAVPQAGRGARLGAAILDVVIMGVMVYLPIVLLVGAENLIIEDSYSALAGMFRQGGVAGLVGPLLLVLVTIWLVHRNGQTLGKKMVGIKVVRSDSSRATLGRIFWLRNVPFWIVSFIPVVGQVVSLVDALLIFRSSRQCLHDQLAGTIVIDA